MLWLALVGALNSVISLFYYARIVAVLYLQDGEPGEVPPLRLAWIDRALCAALVVPILVFGLFWGALWNVAKDVVPAVIGG